MEEIIKLIREYDQTIEIFPGYLGLVLEDPYVMISNTLILVLKHENILSWFYIDSNDRDSWCKITDELRMILMLKFTWKVFNGHIEFS